MKAEYGPFKVQEVVDILARFHTHLGPYLIVGARMAETAIAKLGFDPFKMKVVTYTGTTPPISCMIDGIQFISGCTLGKGNILVVDKGIPLAEFTLNDKTIRLRLKELINLKGLASEEVRKVALEYVKAPIEDFLEIE
ncbi:MAG: formylmethanofuran dehydrogenase subunit E family protein [Promethearchaeota archaeon]